MKYLENYLTRIKEKGNIGLAESIEKTAASVKPRIEKFSYSEHDTGLLFGNVQSGKTGQMFGLLTQAADMGFSVFIILTTDNITLHQQTLERVRQDLPEFLICGENDSTLFEDNNLEKPAVIVLKKNNRILRLWANVLKNTGFVRGNPLFIIDDEADAASLNTLVNKNRVSATNKNLSLIKNESLSSIYLQVTGTPQALFLQTAASGWKPLFTQYFAPGKGYLGGDFFFPAKGKPEHVTFLSKKDDSIEELVLRHLLVSAQILLSGGKVSNCLFHPGARVHQHKSILTKVKKALDNLKKDPELDKKIADIFANLHPEKSELISLESAREWVKEAIKHEDYKLIEMNGKNEVQPSLYESGCNFISGGNNLGRGVTFPSLNTVYYTRTAKNPQADTMWQHSRMFGYDRDPGLMMLYLDEKLYKLFSDINATNNAMIAQAEKGTSDIKVFYPEGLSPTRRNVLDDKAVFAVAGGTNYFAANPSNPDISKLDKILEPFTGAESTMISLRLIKEILQNVEPSSDFSMEAFLSVINTLLAEKPNAQGILAVRKNRHVTQGTGALLSPNDSQLSKEFDDKTVLILYEINGEHGWKQNRLYVPNIKLPNNVLFYDVTDSEK